MNPSPSFVQTSPPAKASDHPRSTQRAERAYRDVTIAAVLLLVASLMFFW